MLPLLNESLSALCRHQLLNHAHLNSFKVLADIGSVKERWLILWQNAISAQFLKVLPDTSIEWNPWKTSLLFLHRVLGRGFSKSTTPYMLLL